jgi:hypothetical protein
MLETLFIWGLVLLPLAVAIVLIAYRARFFFLGITLIVLVMMLIWAGLKLAIMFSDEPDPALRTTDAAIKLIACVDKERHTVFLNCGA